MKIGVAARLDKAESRIDSFAMPPPSAKGNGNLGRVPIALVTGSSRGLGRGIALELARSGFSVAIHYSGNEAAALETARACREAATAAGQEFDIFQADLSDPAARSRLAGEVFARFGTLDALVNNAGMGPRVREDIVYATEASFDEVLKTNLYGPYFLTQDIARRWLEGDNATKNESVPGAALPEGCPIPGGRKIVFVTSISSETISTARGEYCVSKAGLSMAAALWATRLAAEGIQVYEVRPGIMLTDMTSGVKGKYDALIGQGIVPQMRWGSPEDIGRAVRSLLTGDFAFSTGSVINVDGGFHLSRL